MGTPRPLKSGGGDASSLNPNKLPLHVVQTLAQISEVPFQNPPAIPSPEAGNLVTFAEMSAILILGIPEETPGVLLSSLV